MVKLFFTRAPAERDYRDDPLAHPDLASMTLEQLADLPFEPYAAVPCAEEAGVVKPQLLRWLLERFAGRSPAPRRCA